ncbi:hypothetical protein ACLIYM_25470 [Streptomyces fenghuangensis]
MSRSRPVITCSACGEPGQHAGRGWCKTCYSRWYAQGKPADGPSPRRIVQCGTVQGWDKHMRDKTPPCIPCRKAHNEAVLAHYHAKGKPRQLYALRHYTEAPDSWTDEQFRAACTVRAHAVDEDDRQLLLEALGMAPSAAPRLPQRVGGVAA